MVYIYALVDPNTERIRYIGATKHPAQRKYNHSREKTNMQKVLWYASLSEQGKEPIFKILRECKEDWRHWEQLHIREELKKGDLLLNKQVKMRQVVKPPIKPHIKYSVYFEKEEWDFIQSYKSAMGVTEQYFIVEAVKKTIIDLQAEQIIREQNYYEKIIYYTIMKLENGEWVDIFPDQYLPEKQAESLLVTLRESGVRTDYSDTEKYKVGIKPEKLYQLH